MVELRNRYSLFKEQLGKLPTEFSLHISSDPEIPFPGIFLQTIYQCKERCRCGRCSPSTFCKSRRHWEQHGKSCLHKAWPILTRVANEKTQETLDCGHKNPPKQQVLKKKSDIIYMVCYFFGEKSQEEDKQRK